MHKEKQTGKVWEQTAFFGGDGRVHSKETEVGRMTDDRDHWKKRNANDQEAVGRETLACTAAGGGACAPCTLRRERRVRQVQSSLFGRRDRTDGAGAQLLTKDELADGVRLACEARVSAPCRRSIRIERDDKNLAVLLDGEEGAPVSSVVGDSRAEGSEADGAIAVDIGTDHTCSGAVLFKRRADACDGVRCE